LSPKTRWLLGPVALFALLLVEWDIPRRSGALRLGRAFDVSRPLRAGAMKVRLLPPVPVVRPGFRYPRIVAVSEHDPLEVRALVLRAGGRGFAIVLVDLLVVSEELELSLERRVTDLHLDAVILIATHTHSSVGGFDDHVLAQVVGTGRYRPDVWNGLVDRAEEALRGAAKRLVRVHVRTAATRIEGWAVNRSTPGGAVDDALTVAVLESDIGERIATLAIAAAHPTLFPKTVPALSADYPGLAMRRIESGGGVALLLQGALGDAAPPGEGWMAMEAAGAFLAKRVAETLAAASPVHDRLGLSEVQIRLPAVDVREIPFFLLRRPASNVVRWMLPHRARVGLVTLGDLMLLTLPGEPTELAAAQMVASLPRARLQGRKVRLVALAQGYISYIDTEERVRTRHGEAARAWYGPALMNVIRSGLRLTIDERGDAA